MVGTIKLYIYPKGRGGVRQPTGSIFFRAPEQQSMASVEDTAMEAQSVARQQQTSRTPDSEPASEESTEDTAMDTCPDQSSGMRQGIGSVFMAAPEGTSISCQELVSDILGIVPSVGKQKSKRKTKGNKTKQRNQTKSQSKAKDKPRKKTQKPREKAWDPRLIFNHGINLLSTGVAILQNEF